MPNARPRAPVILLVAALAASSVLSGCKSDARKTDRKEDVDEKKDKKEKKEEKKKGKSPEEKKWEEFESALSRALLEEAPASPDKFQYKQSDDGFDGASLGGDLKHESLPAQYRPSGLRLCSDPENRKAAHIRLKYVDALTSYKAVIADFPKLGKIKKLGSANTEDVYVIEDGVLRGAILIFPTNPSDPKVVEEVQLVTKAGVDSHNVSHACFLPPVLKVARGE